MGPAQEDNAAHLESMAPNLSLLDTRTEGTPRS
jgi:hypothetical protein